MHIKSTSLALLPHSLSVRMQIPWLRFNNLQVWSSHVETCTDYPWWASHWCFRAELLSDQRKCSCRLDQPYAKHVYFHTLDSSEGPSWVTAATDLQASSSVSSVPQNWTPTEEGPPQELILGTISLSCRCLAGRLPSIPNKFIIRHRMNILSVWPGVVSPAMVSSTYTQPFFQHTVLVGNWESKCNFVCTIQRVHIYSQLNVHTYKSHILLTCFPISHQYLFNILTNSIQIWQKERDFTAC